MVELGVLASDYLKKVSSFYVCSICLRKLLFKLKENETECHTEGRIPLEMCLEIIHRLFFYLQE